jgi:hypothetical protein
MIRTRTILTTALGATAVAASAVALAAASTAAPAGPATHTFTVKLHQTSDKSIDLGKKGFSAGDEEIGAAEVTRHGQRAGWADLSCSTVRVGRTSADQICEFVLHLGGAQLTASGSVRAGKHGPGTFALPILGGTGTYRGASGQLAITATNGSTVPVTIELDN